MPMTKTTTMTSNRHSTQQPKPCEFDIRFKRTNYKIEEKLKKRVNEGKGKQKARKKINNKKMNVTVSLDKKKLVTQRIINTWAQQNQTKWARFNDKCFNTVIIPFLCIVFHNFSNALYFFCCFSLSRSFSFFLFIFRFIFCLHIVCCCCCVLVVCVYAFFLGRCLFIVSLNVFCTWPLIG